MGLRGFALTAVLLAVQAGLMQRYYQKQAGEAGEGPGRELNTCAPPRRPAPCCWGAAAVR